VRSIDGASMAEVTTQATDNLVDLVEWLDEELRAVPEASKLDFLLNLVVAETYRCATLAALAFAESQKGGV